MAVLSFSGTAAINSAIKFFDFSFPNTLTVIGRTENISVNEITSAPTHYSSPPYSHLFPLPASSMPNKDSKGKHSICLHVAAEIVQSPVLRKVNTKLVSEKET